MLRVVEIISQEGKLIHIFFPVRKEKIRNAQVVFIITLPNSNK